MTIIIIPLQLTTPYNHSKDDPIYGHLFYYIIIIIIIIITISIMLNLLI